MNKLFANATADPSWSTNLLDNSIDGGLAGTKGD